MMLGIRSLSYVNARRLLKISSSLNKSRIAGIMNRRGCGNREVVGHGLNGTYMYSDQTDCPFPAIRFRENTPELVALREKERGDWRSLSIEEKKILYRASFCLTFAEIDAPTGEWKSILALVTLMICATLWIWVFIHIFVHEKAPKSFSEESRAAQYWRQEAINNQPFSGNYKPKNADKYKPVAEETTEDEEESEKKRN